MPADYNISPADGVAAAIGDGKKHLLLCASGSVAVIKLPSIVRYLVGKHESLSIRIILTENAARFFNGTCELEQPSLQALRSIRGVDGLYRDEDEWNPPWRRGAAILHIELRRWADIMVIAPTSANTLAKLAGGMCDGLLTSVARAWDPARGRIIVAPAMNSFMWAHPVTAKHIGQLEGEWGAHHGGWFVVLSPVAKKLACGDEAMGAMVHWIALSEVVIRMLRPWPLSELLQQSEAA